MKFRAHEINMTTWAIRNEYNYYDVFLDKIIRAKTNHNVTLIFMHIEDIKVITAPIYENTIAVIKSEIWTTKQK